MQTTLLTIAIAVILAVAAALAAPFFIDWTTYRAVFEREATRLTGLEIQVGGKIDATLLPAPRLHLQDVTIGGGSEQLRARALTLEFALGPLMRGEWRADEMRLVGPQLKLAVDQNGALSGPNIAVALDPDAISIERLGIEDGKIILDDAASKTSVTLEKVWFNGELRSLYGPLRGEGALTLGGDLYPYRVTSGRLSEANTLRLRLNVDPVNLPLNLESDGTLTFAGKPQFEGTLGVSRPVGIAARDGGGPVTQPWRLGGKLKVTPASALLQEAEFSYGSEPNSVKLTGTAELMFGARPRFDGVLSARQIDLDRLAGEGEANTRSPPALSIRRLAALTGQAFKPSFPVQIGLGIDQVTLGGADVYGVRGDVSTAAEGWRLDRFEFRAPGFTQVRLSGALAVGRAGVDFTGPAEIAANDPQALAAWLEGRADTSRTQPPRPLRLRGDLTLGTQKLAIDRLNASLERGSITGSFAYSFATAQQGARVDANLNAPELDLDAVNAFGRALLAGSAVAPPSEASLAIEIGRASFAGFDAGKTSARLEYGKNGVRIDRLSVDNLGGASITASGQIALMPTPRGNLTFDLNARELAGVNTLIARYSPDLAARLRGAGASLAPAKLRANLKVEDAAPGNRATIAVDGTAGVLRINAEAQAGLGRLALDALPANATNVRMRGQVGSDNAQVLAGLLGIDRYVAVGKEAGNLTLSANGSELGRLQVEGRLNGGGFDGNASGNITYTIGGVSQAAGRVVLNRADFAPLRGAPLPANLNGRVTYTPDKIALDDMTGSVAGTNLRGKLALGLGSPRALSGELDIDSLDAGAVLAAAIGMPSGAALWNWPAEPFAEKLPEQLSGSLSLRAMRATLPPNVAARELRATLKLGRDEITLDDVSANVAGGRLTGSVVFNEAPDGLATRTKIALTNAEVTAFLPDATRPAITGRLTLNADLEGAGRSPQALVGSLQGGGRITLTNAELAGLDPRAFATVTRAADQGLPVERPRVESITGHALTSGRLAARELQGDLAIGAGQVRLANMRAKGEGADVSVTGALDLTIGTVDARLILTGIEQAGGARPDIFLSLRGPISAPERNIDVSALTSWLTLRAIEQQSKKLEAIEKEPPPAAPAAAPPPVMSPAAPAQPAPTASPPGLEPPKAEATAPKAEAPAPRPQRPAAAPPLPPPLDITPRPSWAPPIIRSVPPPPSLRP